MNTPPDYVAVQIPLDVEPSPIPYDILAAILIHKLEERGVRAEVTQADLDWIAGKHIVGGWSNDQTSFIYTIGVAIGH